MKRTFSGGVHPLSHIHEGKRLSNNSAILSIDAPEIVSIPVSQHAGAPAVPCVAVGDSVMMGQVIAKANGFVSANVHASVSGRVKAIEKKQLLMGMGDCIVIENDGLDTKDPSLEKRNPQELNPKQMLQIIAEAGIVGMGGAAFPLHVKLSPPPDKTIDTIILNGSECEPFLTIDARTMVRHGWEVMAGLKLCQKIVNAKHAVIGIEDNKPDALLCMHDLCASEKVELIALKTKYPQGSEKQLIKACAKREVPSGKLPFDAGVIVVNVATCFAVYNAVYNGSPLYESALTVSGCVSNPKNVLVRVGTPFKDAIEACGGYAHEVKKVLSGGPMMGIAVPSLDIPIVKSTSGIIALDEDLTKIYEEHDCIRCGKCAQVCPMGLQPLYLNAYATRNDFDTTLSYHVMDCMECGSCSYACPSNRYLLPSIRLAKWQINLNRRLEKEAAHAKQ